jgi:hypothetical protein
MVAVDLSGGLHASKDHFLVHRPDDPDFRESASVWVFDHDGVVGLPRVGIEAVAGSWDQRGLQVNVGFPSGRTVVAGGSGPGASPADDDGVCRTLRADGLEFRCIEPFVRSTVHFEGTALDTSAENLASGDWSGLQVPVEVDVELECAVPPWVSGTLTPEARRLFEGGFATHISPRYEQLCTASGSVRVGADRWAIDGTALRIHRQGPRDVSDFWGHCWPSALFPSGRAFGALAYPEREDGGPTYNEGFVFDGTTRTPALLVDAPWLRRLQSNGEDVPITLRTAEGDVRIHGVTVLSACMPARTHPDFPPALQHAGVRYTWDGEEAYGMMERSMPAERLG